MKVSRLGLVSSALLLAACQGSVHMGKGSSSPSTGGGTTAANPPAAPAPAPMPHVPPPAPSNPLPTVPPTAPSANQPQARNIPRLRHMGLRQTPPPVVANVSSPRNPNSPNHPTKIRLRAPSPCGPQEVAPGVVVHIDCIKYQPMTKARFVSPLKRLHLYRKGAMSTDADSVSGTAKPPAPPPKPGAPPTVGDAPLPATVDHRVDGTEGPVKDQDVVGSCTGFSLSTTVDNAIRRLNKADVISPMHIWSHYGYPNMGNAGDSNYLKPLAVAGDWPYDPKLACRMYSGPNQFSCGEEFSPSVQQNSASNDPAVQQKIKDADAKGKYKITNITRIFDGSGTPDTDALAGVLASGKDIWVAFTIDSKSWGLAATAAGEIPDYPEGPGGGHAVVLSGYRTKNGTRQFLVHNSWTERWGGPEKGYAWLSDKMVKQSLHDAYTIALSDLSVTPPPPPPDPTPAGTCPTGFSKTADDPACLKNCKTDADCSQDMTCAASGAVSVCTQNSPLTDDDCADDELVDDIRKVCAQMCPDDSRRHNDKCTTATGGGVPKH